MGLLMFVYHIAWQSWHPPCSWCFPLAAAHVANRSSDPPWEPPRPGSTRPRPLPVRCWPCWEPVWGCYVGVQLGVNARILLYYYIHKYIYIYIVYMYIHNHIELFMMSSSNQWLRGPSRTWLYIPYIWDMFATNNMCIENIAGSKFHVWQLATDETQRPEHGSQWVPMGLRNIPWFAAIPTISLDDDLRGLQSHRRWACLGWQPFKTWRFIERVQTVHKLQTWPPQMIRSNEY